MGSITQKQKPVFVTEDGSEFDSRLDALKHQDLMDIKDTIDAFIQSRNLEKASRYRTMLENSLREFTEFAAEYKYKSTPEE